MKGKVWDIVKPKDNWGRKYARMERQRIIDHDLWQPTKYIEVQTDCKHTNVKYSGNDDHTYMECLDCPHYEEL